MMEKLRPIDIKGICEAFESKYLAPFLGNGSVTRELREGLGEVLADYKNFQDRRKKDLSIEKMDFIYHDNTSCVRARNALIAQGIVDLHELESYTERELSLFNGIGAKTLQVIKDEMTKYGLSLRKTEHRNKND